MITRYRNHQSSPPNWTSTWSNNNHSLELLRSVCSPQGQSVSETKIVEMHETYNSIPPSPPPQQEDGPTPSFRDDNEGQRQTRSSILQRVAFTTVLMITCIACTILARRSMRATSRGPDLTAGAPEVSNTLDLLGSSTNNKQEPSTLSVRGQAVKAPRDDLKMYGIALADPYHPVDNPHGYLPMLIAENMLMWRELAARLQTVQQVPLPEWMFGYGDMGGEETFRATMTRILKRWIKTAPVEPDYIRLQAGAGSILDVLSWLLTDPNDGVLVAGPSYGSFSSDFGIHGQARIHVCPTLPSNNYEPTVQELEDCHDKAVKAGNPPKIYVICQPNNPTGVVYTPESMQHQIEWALSKRNMHVVSDEIYALSVFPGVSTTSAADIMYQRSKQHVGTTTDEDATGDYKYLGDYVHIVAGLSKDWGMSGFRVGTLFSHNAQLLQAIDLVGYYEAVSQYTQHALTQLFSDDVWIDWYVAENQKRLAATFEAAREALALIGVSLATNKTQGALFAWADFSAFLRRNQTEEDLWWELFDKAKVAFTTGESCHGEKPGIFRIVYSSPEGGVQAMQEMGRRLVRWKEAREA